MSASHRERVSAPDDHDDDHHGRHVHDAEGLLTRFFEPFDVFPPEKDRDQHRDESGRPVHRQDEGDVGGAEQLVDQAGQIEAGGHAADRSGQDVIEHQRRHGELGQR